MTTLDELLDDYLDGVLERNPHIATVLGVHEHDDEIPSGTRDSVEREIEEALSLREELDDYEGYEAQLVRASLDYDLYEMDEVRAWEHDPGAVDGVVSFVYPIYTRDFAPFTERLARIADRLEKAPDYLEESRGRVTEPAQPWVELEKEACDELVGVLRLVADEAGELERQDLAYRVNVAAQDVVEAVEEHEEWLDSLETTEEWRVGRDTLDELLELRHLPDSETVVEVAHDELEDAEEELSEATEELADDPRDAAEALERDSVPADDVLDEYTKAIREARSLTENLVELPDEGVNVALTPDYLEPLVPETAYFEETPFGDDVPTYYVTGNDLHQHTEIVGNAVSDVYPGTHLRSVSEARSASKAEILAGRFNSFGDDFTEGWRAHAERLAVENGYGGALTRVYRARNRVDSACRAVVDVKLQTGEMTVRDATEFLVDEAGIEEERAVAEAREYGREPGAQVSSLVGARRIEELRRDVLGDDHGRDEERMFHRDLLRGGGVPVAFHRKRLGMD